MFPVDLAEYAAEAAAELGVTTSAPIGRLPQMPTTPSPDAAWALMGPEHGHLPLVRT
jgi:hypothetical protein